MCLREREEAGVCVLRLGDQVATTDPSVTLNTPLSELLEGDAIREALSTDADPFQNSITPQLVQDEVRRQLPRLREQEE